MESLKNLVDIKNAKTIEESLINERGNGLYCIFVKNPEALPIEFRSRLGKENHQNIIYIGQTQGEFGIGARLEQELFHKGHGTFFRSIGATLGQMPVRGHLKGKKRNRKYKFAEKEKAYIKNWLKENCLVNWVVLDGDINRYEKDLIWKHAPVINLENNPRRFASLSKLRKKCSKYANGEE
jgi:hypothetical protein